MARNRAPVAIAATLATTAGIGLWARWLARRQHHWAATLADSIPVNSAFWREQQAKPGELLYVAVGDSAAQGIGASRPAHSYVGFILRRMRELTPRRVSIANLAISGATIRIAIDKELPLLEKLKPDVLTVCIGANDIAAFDAERFDRDVRELFAALPDHAIVADLPSFYFLPGERKVRVANRLLRAAAAERGFTVVDLHAATDRQGLWGVTTQFAGDLFHPNDRGYRIWAGVFADAVAARLAVVEGERAASAMEGAAAGSTEGGTEGGTEASTEGGTKAVVPRETLEQLATRYDGRALTYDESVMHRGLADAVARFARVTAGTTVLDIATGTGLLLRALPASVDRMTGVDISPGMLAVARRELPGAELVETDAARLPFDDASFDLVTCVTGIQFMPEPAAALHEWARVLRPGGRVVLATFAKVGSSSPTALHTPFSTPAKLAQVGAEAGLRMTRHEFWTSDAVSGGAEHEECIISEFCAAGEAGQAVRSIGA